MSISEPLLTEKQAAQVLSASPGTLRNWRTRNKGPAWILLGGAIRYSPQDLRGYLETRTRRPAGVAGFGATA
jgi:hypothetical protein